MQLRSRRSETIIYLSLWVIIIILFLIDRAFNKTNGENQYIDRFLVRDTFLIFLPFILLFLVHNHYILPQLLLKNRYRRYIFSVLCLLGIFWGIMAFQFSGSLPKPPHDKPVRVSPPRTAHAGRYKNLPGYRNNTPDKKHRIERLPIPKHSILPMPLVLDVVYSFLIVGGNLAVALIFQHYDDKLERERLRKVNAENELTYLKAQINPHFYMNMLNNIHSMIDIDTEKAQKMLIDMSRLMRYMLYESGKPEIPLSDEIDFIFNYIELMKMRIRQDKVRISAHYPNKDDIHSILVPPLLFIVFIENAFKHGVSYREESFITIDMAIEGDHVFFCCMNSKSGFRNRGQQSGIGLKNIRQRLRLLYGESAELKISESEAAFFVSLLIPINKRTNETENIDN